MSASDTFATLWDQRYYNDARTHLSLNKDAPASRAVQAVGRIMANPHSEVCTIKGICLYKLIPDAGVGKVTAVTKPERYQIQRAMPLLVPGRHSSPSSPSGSSSCTSGCFSRCEFFAISSERDGLIYYSRCNFSSGERRAIHCFDLV
jgi:hypothetical protein